MKKNEYMAPEMEIVKIEYNKILMASGEEAPDPNDKDYD